MFKIQLINNAYSLGCFNCCNRPASFWTPAHVASRISHVTSSQRAPRYLLIHRSALAEA